MRGSIVAGLMIAVSVTGAHAEDACASERARISRATSQYSATLDQLRVARRELGSFSHLDDEGKLRAVRQYGLLQRDADNHRNRVLVVYEALVQLGCESFDKQGYDRAVSAFRRISDEEREVLAEAKRLSGSRVVGAN